MSKSAKQTMSDLLTRLLNAISTVDAATIATSCTSDVVLAVPGARYVDLTQDSQGCEALVDWAKSIHNLCGMTTFSIDRFFENANEIMASGSIAIERLPRHFSSACSIHARFEGDRIAFFQLLLNTYALEKFRGEMD
jgi:hypothetical protein